MGSRRSSACAESKGIVFLADAAVFCIICFATILIVLSSVQPPPGTSGLEAFVLAQDTAESCCILGRWDQECLRILGDHGIRYCPDGGCGEYRIERECAGGRRVLGFSPPDNYPVNPFPDH